MRTVSGNADLDNLEVLTMPKVSIGINLVLLTLCGLVSFMEAVTAQAATYYVATTGNDANTCAQSQSTATPKRSFNLALACMSAGDILYIRSGTYTEQIDIQTVNLTGTAGNYITIAGYPGETVTLSFTDGANMYGPIKARGNRGWFIFENLVLDGANGGDGSGWQLRDGNHDFILRNLKITNFKYHGFYISGTNITVQNCKIYNQISLTGLPGTRWYGLYVHDGANILIENNDIYNNPGGGMQAYNGGSGTVTGLVIRNNKIHDNNTLTSSQVGGIVVMAPDATRPISGVQIYNNLVYTNGSAPTHGESAGIRISTNIDSAKVWNNTVYGNAAYNGNGGWGISIEASTTTNTVVQNNIVYQNAGGQINNTGMGSIIDHNMTSNPNFVNASAFDFNLQAGSPAIDAGVGLSQVTTDFKTNRRPQGLTHDIGAYEMGTGSASAPSPPHGLRVF